MTDDLYSLNGKNAVVTGEPVPRLYVNALVDGASDTDPYRGSIWKPYATLEQQRLDLGRGASLARRVAEILEQQLDRLRCVLLVRADHAARAALDPARDVHAGRDAAALVRDRAGLLVEWDTGKRDAAIADAAKDDARRHGLALAGRDSAERAGRVGFEPVPHEVDRLDPTPARDLHRRPARGRRHLHA